MLRITLCLSSLFFTIAAFSQYWIGPKIGASYIDHIYSDKTYEGTTTDTEIRSLGVDENINFQAGLAVNYTTETIYSFYGELMYEQIGKELGFAEGLIDDPSSTVFGVTSMKNHFITAPLMLRVTLGHLPFHYYINGGPRLSYWLGGSGEMAIDEFVEFGSPNDDGSEVYVYQVTFNSKKAQENTDKALVSKPNRVQYGLALGAGIILDVFNQSRLQIDFRFTWVHSNMGTNNGTDDINFEFPGYRENFEYSHNMASVGIAYMLEYNKNLKRRGKSTNKSSNKR